MPALHDLNDAALDQFIRRQLVNALALVFDRTLGHIAAFGVQQVRNGFQRRRFAGTVGAQQGDNLPLGDVQGNALEHQDHVVVNDLDVVDVQVAVGRCCVGLCTHGCSRSMETGKQRGVPPRVSSLSLYFSLEQSRGVMPFSLAYCLAEAWNKG